MCIRDRDYLLSETDRISKSFQRNLAFYQYHRTKATYLDGQYFMRGKPDRQIIVDSFYYETDPQFSTSYDFKVAKILANELLEIYLTNRLHELDVYKRQILHISCICMIKKRNTQEP